MSPERRRARSEAIFLSASANGSGADGAGAGAEGARRPLTAAMMAVAMLVIAPIAALTHPQRSDLSGAVIGRAPSR